MPIQHTPMTTECNGIGFETIMKFEDRGWHYYWKTLSWDQN